MDERTLHALEFPRVLERLSDFCLSEAGKEAALLLRPMNDAQAVRDAQLRYDETRSWLAEGDFSPVSFPDISGLLAHVRTHADPMLDMDGLWALKETLGLARRAAESIHAGASRRPLLDALACELPMPELSLSALMRCVSDDGYLKDESSPGLLLVRGELRGIHQNCLRRVKEFAEKYNIGRYLQDDYMTLSSDRYVLPLKANFKGRIQGIIHDYSNTGETLYFEPMFLVEQNNRLQELKQQEREEERKVMRMIADLLVQEMPQVEAAWKLLVEIDLGQAKCALGAALSGRCVPLEENALLSLPGARHPLLVLEAVRHAADKNYAGPRRIEPADLMLREGDRVLVISGGNAGGKTVALKTLGLITLMTLAGLPVPVDGGATLPYWNRVHAFIGDEQSLDDHVSTFTGQIHHLASIWESLDGHSLVLLDEFGSGTDPSQGAALAQAVLDGMLEKGAYTVTATHFPALKSYALTHDGVRAASVLFDPSTKKPLFHLAYDQVGASQALDVAREHGQTQRARPAAGRGTRPPQGRGAPHARQARVSPAEAGKGTSETRRGSAQDVAGAHARLQERQGHGQAGPEGDVEAPGRSRPFRARHGGGKACGRSFRLHRGRRSAAPHVEPQGRAARTRREERQGQDRPERRDHVGPAFRSSARLRRAFRAQGNRDRHQFPFCVLT